MANDWHKKTRELIHVRQANAIAPNRHKAWYTEQAVHGAVRQILMNADREIDDQNTSRHVESGPVETHVFSHLAAGTYELALGLALLLTGILICLGAEIFSDLSLRLTLWLTSLICVGYGARNIDLANACWPQLAGLKTAIFGLSQIAVAAFAVASTKVFGGAEQTIVLWSYAVISVVIGARNVRIGIGPHAPKSLRGSSATIS